MRPEILFPLFAPSTSLKGVGPKIAPLVEKLAGPLVRDVLLLAPSGVVERRRAKAAEAREGEAQIFLVRIDAHLPPRSAAQPYRIRVADETGFLFLVYFKVFGDSLKRQHPPGALRAVSGRVQRWEHGVEYQINHPDYLLPAERIDEIPTFEAIYPATAGLPSRTVRKLAHEALERAPAIPGGPTADRLGAALPFRLTGAQVMALAEIRGDLQAGERMSRLLQGDVGAGKTVVAMLAMADAADAGLQSALMAPTEILARQHFETIAEPLQAQGVGVALLTGRDKGAARAAKLRALASGEAKVAVGTHALFQDDVSFASLGLAVIDEQHRFGVDQRRRLQDKGGAAHLLAMSATPIPRTLELTLYGDLDVSRLAEKPPGRTPVATRAAPTSRIGEVVERLRQATSSGAQAFWICPLVSESETTDLAAAEKRAETLGRALGPGVGLVHGAMAAQEKDAVMADFAEGRLAVLVATTVVEVGVNVPNASIMVIEQAERFGLAQLHQLRGRVGRGARESACVLLYDPPLSEAAQRRLDILRRTDDGFLIAEKDLELRGGGDPLGLKQSGLPAYRLADPIVHRDLILTAADDARLLLNRDPDLDSERGRAARVLAELFDWKPEKPAD